MIDLEENITQFYFIPKVTKRFLIEMISEFHITLKLLQEHKEEKHAIMFLQRS